MNDRQKWIIDQVCGKTILDVGFIDSCSGQSLIHAKTLAKNPASLVIGLDNHPPILARTKYPNCVAGDLLELPFTDGVFDCVVVGEVLEHVVDLAQAVRELSRVTKRGGVVIITTPSPYAIFRLVRNWYLPRLIEERGNISFFLGSADHKAFWEPNLFSLVGLECKTVTTRCLTIQYVPSWLKNPPLHFWPFDRWGTYFCAVFKKK